MVDPVLESAAVKADAAILAGRGDAYDYMVVGLLRSAQGAYAAARKCLDKAIALEPDNPAIIIGLAIWHREQGDLRNAVLACDRAIGIAPDYADAWIERGKILAAGGSSRLARDSFERAAGLSPLNAGAWAGLAAEASREGDYLVARISAQRALAINAQNLDAATSLASVLVAEGKAVDAQALLAPLILASPASAERSMAANVLGRASQATGDFAAAFKAFDQSNSDFAQCNSTAKGLAHTEFVEAIISALETLSPALIHEEKRGSSPGGPAHIFLIGYPRSGTTLVENILTSLPGTAATEEWPSFSEADHRFLSGDARSIGEGVEAFLLLNTDEREALRAAYWRQVASAGISRAATHYIDMDPLKATRLPFVGLLFPHAHILIMRRDPRDVVLSCFKTSFAATSAAMEFTSLERAARHYDAMMRLTDLAINTFSLNAFDVDYQRLTQDFDSVTREICAFIGVEWTPSVGRFQDTAKRRGVTTASAAQVRQALYDGSGQWRAYAEWLEPIIAILAPWIERFGSED